MCRSDTGGQHCAESARQSINGQTVSLTNLKTDIQRLKAGLDLSCSLSVFLFDWDDTLFPTTAVRSLGPEVLGDVLKTIDTVVAGLLSALLAIPNSRIVILTNARISWVQHAAENFLPNVHALLSAGDESGPFILVRSAHRERSQFACAAAYEEAMRCSKSEAVWPLSRVLQQVARELEVQFCQVFSVGDQAHDLEAGHTLHDLLCSVDMGRAPFQQSFIKTVAMKTMPTGVELAKQLSTLGKALPKLSVTARSFHQSMSPVQPAPPFSKAEPSSTGKAQSLNADGTGPLCRRDRVNTWQDDAQKAQLVVQEPGGVGVGC